MLQVGKKMVCTVDDGWIDEETEQETIGPLKDEILTVSRSEKGLLAFREYPDLDTDGEPAGYDAEFFRPLEDFPGHSTYTRTFLRQITNKFCR